MLGSSSAAWLARARLASVRRVRTPELEDLAASCRRLPAEQRAATIRARAPTTEWLQRVADVLDAQVDAPVRTALLNDALLDLEHELERCAAWPRAAVRVALASAGLAAIFAFTAGETWLVPWLLGLGGAAAVLCAAADRRARTEAKAERTAVDGLIASVFGAPAPPARARGRRHARA